MIVSIIHSPIPYEEPDRLRSGFQLEYARQWRGEKRKASSVIEATSSCTLRAAQKFTYNNLEFQKVVAASLQGLKSRILIMRAPREGSPHPRPCLLPFILSTLNHKTLKPEPFRNAANLTSGLLRSRSLPPSSMPQPATSA